jgi:hypothetical protein
MQDEQIKRTNLNMRAEANNSVLDLGFLQNEYSITAFGRWGKMGNYVR